MRCRCAKATGGCPPTRSGTARGCGALLNPTGASPPCCFPRNTRGTVRVVMHAGPASLWPSCRTRRLSCGGQPGTKPVCPAPHCRCHDVTAFSYPGCRGREPLPYRALSHPVRHRGLRRLYEENDPRGVMAEHAEKLRDILARLEAARVVTDMDLPGFRLHPLRGNLRGYWAVTVRANWRVIFRFADGEASEVDYVDYH